MLKNIKEYWFCAWKKANMKYEISKINYQVLTYTCVECEKFQLTRIYLVHLNLVNFKEHISSFRDSSWC